MGRDRWGKIHLADYPVVHIIYLSYCLQAIAIPFKSRYSEFTQKVLEDENAKIDGHEKLLIYKNLLFGEASSCSQDLA